MATDDERREVARTIRHAWVNVPDRDPVRHHLRVLNEIYEAVGISDGKADAIDLFNRLADLIEPSDHIGDPDKMVDRDALLALADEMQRELDECASDHEIVGKLQYRIDRIREALGASE